MAFVLRSREGKKDVFLLARKTSGPKKAPRLCRLRKRGYSLEWRTDRLSPLSSRRGWRRGEGVKGGGVPQNAPRAILFVALATKRKEEGKGGLDVCGHLLPEREKGVVFLN